VSAPAPRTFAAQRAHAGARVDRFLVEAFARAGESVSRAELQRWIEHGRVRVAGRGCKAADKLREGDVVDVEPEPPATTSARPDASVPFEVMFVDESVIVVNKPAGVVVHPARGHASGTLVNGLLALGLFDAAALEGDERDEAGHMRPGIVHRLDKGTSGVMVVARTGEARERLKAQFQKHTIEREYQAIVVGEAHSRTISSFHARHPTDRLRFTSLVPKGKRAVTHVRVLTRLGNGVATLIACTLETGRTHQIRMHMADVGTPVLGDPLYGRPPRDAALRALGEELGHQALHARLLAFEHPVTRAWVRFEAPPPADFQAALETLARRRG
jgi:23S rRNA pseudouridine1911/1915/1917 synthase